MFLCSGRELLASENLGAARLTLLTFSICGLAFLHISVGGIVVLNAKCLTLLFDAETQ
jgi:hypothetical protein